MVKELPKSAVIIGGGIGGLATAILLARAGIDVTLCEQHAKVGGRAGILEEEGFRFDTGPSWFLMPEVFEHFFMVAGSSLDKHLHLQRLEPGYKVFFESGVGPLQIYGDYDKDAATFAGLEPGADKALKRYLVQAEKTYKIATESFLYTNFDNYAAFFKPSTFLGIPSIALAAAQSIDHYVSKFVKTPELKQLLEYHMVFLGTSPYKAPSIFRLMGFMDYCQGVFYPEGGIYSLIVAMENLAKEYGVTIRTNVPVTSIAVDGKNAQGIMLDGGEYIQADVVISNADLQFTETKLLPTEARSYSDRYFAKQTPSPSALLMYFGVKGSLPELQHHNLLFTKDWKKNFQEIITEKKWSTPASMYVCKPSETDNTVAPEGYENVFVLVPVAAGLSHVSDDELDDYADMYLGQLADYAHIPDLKERIVYKKLCGPRDFATLYNTPEGSMLGPANSLFQSALWRSSTKSKKIKNLYYVGATVQPGIGLPLCLISAELVYKRIVGDRTIAPLAEAIARQV